MVSWWRVCDKHKSQLLVVFHQAWGVSSSVDIVCYFCCCCLSIVVAVFACSLMFEQYFSALVWVEEGAVSLRVHSGNFSTKTKYNSISCLIIYSSLTAWVHSGNFFLLHQNPIQFLLLPDPVHFFLRSGAFRQLFPKSNTISSFAWSFTLLVIILFQQPGRPRVQGEEERMPNWKVQFFFIVFANSWYFCIRFRWHQKK